MELFRKVLIKDRLPEKEEYYMTNDGNKYFYHNGQEFIEWDDSPAGMVEWWLEAIQLPTDEDAVYWIIQNVLRSLSSEKQKEVTKFLLSRKMIDLPTDEKIEIASYDANAGGIESPNLAAKAGFEQGVEWLLELLTNKK